VGGCAFGRCACWWSAYTTRTRLRQHFLHDPSAHRWRFHFAPVPARKPFSDEGRRRRLGLDLHNRMGVPRMGVPSTTWDVGFKFALRTQVFCCAKIKSDQIRLISI